ncbi:hypothetical protein JXI42_05220 [bacterium]|nr:hypothetical protein [bacterium]
MAYPKVMFFITSFTWSPDETISSGIYLVRASCGGKSITKRVVYLK